MTMPDWAAHEPEALARRGLLAGLAGASGSCGRFMHGPLATAHCPLRLTGGLVEEVTDFFIRRLREVLVPPADGVERLRHAGADGFVRLVLEFRAGLGCSDRDRHDDAT